MFTDQSSEVGLGGGDGGGGWGGVDGDGCSDIKMIISPSSFTLSLSLIPCVY